MYVAPESMTVPGARFFHDSMQSEILSFVALHILIHPGMFSRTIASIVGNWGRDNPALQEVLTDDVVQRIAGGKSGTGIQGQLSRFQLKLIHCRLVDTFLIYLTDLSADVFITRPETLRSGDQVRIDEILQLVDMEEVVAFLAERQITRLSHRGFDDLSKHFEERFGLLIVDNSEDRDYIGRMVAVRNLIVHNHGIINDQFIRQAPSFFEDADPYDLKGHKVELNPENVVTGMHRLRCAVASLDERTAMKFGLQQSIGNEHMITWGKIIEDLIGDNGSPLDS